MDSKNTVELWEFFEGIIIGGRLGRCCGIDDLVDFE